MLLEDILLKYPPSEEHLIEILLEFQTQKETHYISEEEIAKIASYLHISESRVCSTNSFYSFFSDKPRGKHIIQVCKDIPCYVNDSFNVLETLQKLLGIHVGETTANKKFTLETTSCIGCCDNPPAIRIDGKMYTNLTVDKIKAIIAEYRG